MAAKGFSSFMVSLSAPSVNSKSLANFARKPISVQGRQLVHLKCPCHNSKQYRRYDTDQALRLLNFSCSLQLSTKFILLINVKMPTIVGILTFMSMINTTSERLKARNFFIWQYFSFYEQLKFHVKLGAQTHIDRVNTIIIPFPYS